MVTSEKGGSMRKHYRYMPIGDHPPWQTTDDSFITRLLWLAGSVALVLFMITQPWRSLQPVIFTLSSESNTSIRNYDVSVDEAGARSRDFELYKVALSSRVGDSAWIRDFVNQTIALVDRNFDLGCDGVKVNGYLMPSGPQLHWVESPILSNDPTPIEEWQAYFEELNAGLAEFNALLHNKVSMFTTNLTLQVARFRELSVPLMLRRSSGYSGAASPVGELAHVLFPIAGRAYELMAPISDQEVKETRSWPEWSSDLDECPQAQRLDKNLDEYVAAYHSYVSEASSLMQSWANERGFFPPMLALVSVAIVSDDVEALNRTLFEDLSRIADIKTFTEDDSRRIEAKECTVYRVPTVSSKGFRVPVRYIINNPANNRLVRESQGHSVGDYNSYINSTHRTITGGYRNWAGWDHWLDQHIGLKYVGERASDIAATLNSVLSSRGLPVGQRTTADYGKKKAVHWYTGYGGSMTWEYWVSGCASYSVNNEADVCACLPANNDIMYYEVRVSNLSFIRENPAQESGDNCTDLGEWYSDSETSADYSALKLPR